MDQSWPWGSQKADKKELCYVCFHIYICCKLHYIRFRIYTCLLLLSMNLFVCHFIPPSEISEGIVCVSACVNIYLSICLSVYLSICLLDWSFTFTEKSDCDKAKQVLSMISITSILVELTQIIGWYVNSSVVGLSVFLSVSSKDMRFTSKWYYVYISHFRRGTWCSSHYGELVKKLKF